VAACRAHEPKQPVQGTPPCRHHRSCCLRSCVAHRGFDYGGTEEGQYPWGGSSKLSDATQWLHTAVVTNELKDIIEDKLDELEADKSPEERRAAFREELRQRLDWSRAHDIETILRLHSKGGHDNLRPRARGVNFPRKQVWEHIEKIVRHPRHREFLRDPEAFLNELGINPNEAGGATAKERLANATRARRKAIFHYNRKAYPEMERHWAKKVNDCPYASRIDTSLAGKKITCGENGELSIRKWSALEFSATRRVEMETIFGKGKEKRIRRSLHSLSAGAVGKILEAIERHDRALKSGDKAAAPSWDEVKAIIEEDLPTPADAKVKLATSKKGDWNETFLEQLRNLTLPSLANRKQRAPLSALAAEKLFALATHDGNDIAPAQFALRLKARGFYDWRRAATVDFNPYRQVEVLLGRRIKHGKKRGQLAESCQGLLRRLFAQHSEALDGSAAPDYCVIEVIGDAPRTSRQAQEIKSAQDERGQKRRELFAAHKLEDSGAVSKRRRITLWDQQKGVCPYTGNELPKDPLDPLLELEHIFPAETGGLSTDENLVLTWRTVNGDKGKRTPLEYAARLGVPFEKMLAHTKDMRWTGKKREIFAWGTLREDKDNQKSHYLPDGVTLRIPEFGNTTRTAQLARQLRAEVMRWMQLEEQPDQAARRIGTPSGWLAAQARKSWLAANDYQKVRNNLTHHRIDAAVLAHIPPREGMNSVLCKGIFYVEREPVRDEASGITFHRLVTKALPELSPLPRLKHWLPDNGEYAVCPVLKLRSQSKTKTLGDSTFWRQVSRDEPTLAQRTVLDAGALAKLKIADGGALYAHLLRMGIQSAKIPSREALQNWINAATPASKADNDTALPPLKLTDGTPVKSLWKFDSKGSLSAPMGWSGKRNTDGTLRELRSISLRYDRLEIWLGYDHGCAEKARLNAEKEQRKALKEGRAADAAMFAKAELAGWVYQRRLIPDSGALRHLKQLGFSFGRDKRRNAPPFMQVHPDRPEGHQSVRDLVLGGRLLPFSAKVGQLRKGDVFWLRLTKGGDIITDGSAPYWSSWFRVSATGEDIELKNIIFKEAQDTSLPLGYGNNVLTQKKRSAQVLAAIAGLPLAAAEAARRGLRIQPPPPRPAPPGGGHDPQTALKL
jgi:5-methylcytosine-specific restriction endonuclease McrA